MKEYPFVRRMPVLILFAAFAAFLAASNNYDWDYFTTVNEIDLRSWLVDHRLPIWSYQLCGGVTRIGDPQAYGLSPLFFPILIFGSYWGTKVLIFLAAAFGWFFVGRIGRVVHRAKCGVFEISQDALWTIDNLSAFLVFSNYFLWHFFVGHITFLNHFFLLGLIYYLLKAVFETVSWRDSLVVAVICFSYWTGGFYHSVVFFAIPVALSLLPTAILLLHSGRLKSKRPSLFRFGTGLALGVILSLYKTLSVMHYQHLFPRQVTDGPEPFSPLETLIYQMTPTWNFQVVGFGNRSNMWGIWEFSSFHVLIWILLISLVVLKPSGWRNVFLGDRSVNSKALTYWIFALFAVGVSTSLDSTSLFSLHYWISQALHGSVRVIGRYQVVWIFAAFLAVVSIFSTRPRALTIYNRFIQWPVFAIVLANFLSFWMALSFQNIQAYTEAPTNIPEQMQKIAIARFRDGRDSYMYGPVVAGYIVPNCYDPIQHSTVYLDEDTVRKLPSKNGVVADDVFFPLVDGTSVASCIDHTFVTQNDLHLDPSCPVGTCLKLNGLNPYQENNPHLKPDVFQHRWCLAP